MNDEVEEYCPHCGEWYPVDEHGEIKCECEADPYSDDVAKPLDFN